MTQHKPYSYQLEAIEKLGKKDKQVLILPSGSGKTHTIAFHIRDKKIKSFLYVVHRDEILIQTVNIFKQICGLEDSQIGIIDGDNKEYDRQYLFATIQTLYRDKNLEKFNKNIEYMCIDEFHHVAADSYQKIMDYFDPTYFVGLTATPYRMDEKNIFKYVNNNVAHNIDLFTAIGKKILVPFHYIGLYDDIDYTEIEYNGYNYHIGDLDKKLIIHKRDEAILKEYQQKIEPENRPTIAFCNSIDHVERIVLKFRNAGIKADGITHKQRYQYRKEKLEAFAKGEIKVLFTRDILNEGVDFPKCSAIMFLRPTISRTIFFQQLGRGLRKDSSKEDVLVLDFVGNYVRAFEKIKWFKDPKWKIVESTGKYIKPIYEYNYPKPIIEFDAKVVELMNIQLNSGSYHGHFNTTKEELYNDYLKVCELEGKIVNTEEYKKSKHRNYSIQTFFKVFGSFTNFIKEYKINYTRNYKSLPMFHGCRDPDLLIENYWQVKEKWQKTGRINQRDPISNTPPLGFFNDEKNSRYHGQCYQKTWKSFRIFLHSLGELKYSVHYVNTVLDKEKRDIVILDAFKNLQKKLNKKHISKSEWLKEYGILGKVYFDKEGFDKFRERFDIPIRTINQCQICGKTYTTRFGNRKLFTCSNKSCQSKSHYQRVENNRREVKRQEKLKEKIICLNCGKEFLRYDRSEIRIYPRKYCSKRCMHRLKPLNEKEKGAEK